MDDYTKEMLKRIEDREKEAEAELKKFNDWIEGEDFHVNSWIGRINPNHFSLFGK